MSVASDKSNVSNIINGEIKQHLTRALHLAKGNPVLAATVLKALFYQYRQAKRRQRQIDSGVHVPPYLIYSITRSCNLNCAGCYAREHQKDVRSEMSIAQVESLFSQAVELGVSFVLLAGGEPFTRKEVMELAGGFPQMLFPVFTNGMLITDKIVDALSRNVIPVISLEGDDKQTDGRRGKDVFAHVQRAIQVLDRKRRFWGVSVTVTSENMEEVTSHQFISNLVEQGCKLIFLVEYVPVKADTEHLILSEKQKSGLIDKEKELNAAFPALCFAFPGDEERYGGCLAAGRGFAHIQADGKLEPCPFAPYSDVSVCEMSLRDALQSHYLHILRENHHLLTESKGGCALWMNKEQVNQLLKQEA